MVSKTVRDIRFSPLGKRKEAQKAGPPCDFGDFIFRGASEVGSIEYLVFGEGFDDVLYGRALQLKVGNGVGGGEVGREAVAPSYAVNPSVLLVVFDEGDCVEDVAAVERYVEPGGDQTKEIVNAHMALPFSSYRFCCLSQ